MLMPALLPEKLLFYKDVKTEEELLELLSMNSSDLVSFFEACCEDETWCDTHTLFTKKSLLYLTDQQFRNNISMNLGKTVAKSIQKHYQNLMGWIPLDIIFELEDG